MGEWSQSKWIQAKLRMVAVYILLGGRSLAAEHVDCSLVASTHPSPSPRAAHTRHPPRPCLRSSLDSPSAYSSRGRVLGNSGPMSSRNLAESEFPIKSTLPSGAPSDAECRVLRPRDVGSLMLPFPFPRRGIAAARRMGPSLVAVRQTSFLGSGPSSPPAKRNSCR